MLDGWRLTAFTSELKPVFVSSAQYWWIGGVQANLRSRSSFATHPVSESSSLYSVRCPLPALTPLATLFTSLGRFCVPYVTSLQCLPLYLNYRYIISLLSTSGILFAVGTPVPSRYK